MKTKMLIALLVLISSYVMAQEKKENPKPAEKVNVPELVKKEFAARYPKATKIKWEMENAQEYEAEFKLRDIETSASFDPSGKWLATESNIDISQLPTAISKTITKEYGSYKIHEAEITETFDNKKFYEVELKNDKEKIELKFSLDGEILK